MKNRTVLLYMTFVFLSNFSTILFFLTVYLEFVGFSMVAISSMMIAYQVSKGSVPNVGVELGSRG